MDSSKKELVFVSIRMPADLDQKIRALAEVEARSKTQQIIVLLKKALAV